MRRAKSHPDAAGASPGGSAAVSNAFVNDAIHPPAIFFYARLATG